MTGLLKRIGLLACFASAPQTWGQESASLKQPVFDLGVATVLFATGPYQPNSHWYANFGDDFDPTNRPAYGTGKPGRLAVLTVITEEVKDLLYDETGAVRGPQLSYDGQRIVFSYRKGGSSNFYLYQMNRDTSDLKLLPYWAFYPIYNRIIKC